MAKFIASIKAIITRLVFASHGFVAIWQVTNFKQNPIYWYLCCPIILLFFEGIFTLTIKENQEWKWFCPSVFLYLGSIVPAIWLLELDKVERRMQNFGSNIVLNDTFDLTNVEDLKKLQKTLGTNIRLPEIQMSTETWVTLIEQFLMLILIIGRWMLPKGELTRDQLSQLLLVYIGTAADIIEFFDSFKEDRVAREPLLVYLTLGIWAWSLMQFTVVLTATKSRKSRLSSGTALRKKQTSHSTCCSIDVWAIAINLFLQDGPFLTFRLILIIHYKIVSYMNIFFTCKNTLVILLQLYRLYVVQSEYQTERQKQRMKQHYEKYDIGAVSIISRPHSYDHRQRGKRRRENDNDDSYRNEKRRKRKYEDKKRDLEAKFTNLEKQDSDEFDRYAKPKKTDNNERRSCHGTSNSNSSQRKSPENHHKRSQEDRFRAEKTRSSDSDKSNDKKQPLEQRNLEKSRSKNGRMKTLNGHDMSKKRTDENSKYRNKRVEQVVHSYSDSSSEKTDSESDTSGRYEPRKRRSDRD